MARSLSISLCKRSRFTGLLDQIHFAAKELLQPFLQCLELAEVIETRAREFLSKTHSNIDIVRCFLTAAVEPNRETLTTPAARSSAS
jgi:hypothetical protein